ncbi:MAG TPA: hypothetical protein VKU79_03170 [Thermoplasmataceae archaeon]|nr:hypothetical protein [Thermoplasmataceae archaeon]
MSRKKFSRDDLEIASDEEFDRVAFGEGDNRKKISRNNSGPVPRK